MRYRKLTSTDDYSFGHSQADFLVNTPEAVAQAVLTRLRLFRGEWFLDTTAGLPYQTDVVGKGTTGKYDQAYRSEILNTQNVVSLDFYQSSLNRSSRKLQIRATITTTYGQTALEGLL